MEESKYLQVINRYNREISILSFCLSLLNISLFKSLALGLALELIYLFLLTLEDERSLEISLETLVFLAINKIFIHKDRISFKVFTFALCLYMAIFIIFRASIGLGDVILNSILALAFISIYDYYIFFTLSFLLGALYSIFGLKAGTLDRKSSIGFVKFIVGAYLLKYYGAIIYEHIFIIN